MHFTENQRTWANPSSLSYAEIAWKPKKEKRPVPERTGIGLETLKRPEALEFLIKNSTLILLKSGYCYGPSGGI